MTSERRTYLLANLPGWCLVALAGAAAAAWWDLPASVVVLATGAWVAKDLLLYPSMRRFYRSQPAERRIIGCEGIALGHLDPRGQVRVKGEIWQARLREGGDRVPEGGRIRVTGVDGLLLTVEPD